VDVAARRAVASSPQDQEPSWTELRPAPASDPAPRTIVAEPAARRLASEPGDPSVAGIAGWTVAVVALVAVAALAVRKLLGRAGLLPGGGVIDVVARRAIAPRQDLLLVAVGARLFLIGASREHLVTLGEFSRPDEVAQLRGTGAEQEFRSALRESIREAERAKPPAGVAEPAAPYGGLVDELARIRRTVEGWRA
jgi:flagellar biogenesis protein FliO